MLTFSPTFTVAFMISRPSGRLTKIVPVARLRTTSVVPTRCRSAFTLTTMFRPGVYSVALTGSIEYS